ncbi:MerR family transcriptional regulator [Saccharibacillus sp. CPCC 101409]|uniref:MerR family transcriptional regulator n=1 Tax=Saccharibacillus sp. CPCC 101409 TaxID=3058041 RepID=UPI002670FD65|nr:MerR family DNA-binding transcriptional regulator [Saccharibacillus sp. CPCC 101409]MDO3412368.1 MerR family transcriptional regulator [Saccharibacillus sp. CPCC 101409]
MNADRPETTWTPAQAAAKLGVSTTTLRRYEQQGLIPDVSRVGANRRVYAEPHMRAFEALRALLKAYEIPVAYEAMRRIKSGEVEEALWLLNRQQADIQEEKRRLTETLNRLSHADFPESEPRGRRTASGITIGEAAKIAGVNASAVRHWEQEGLIASTRSPGSGYRLFDPREVRRIIVIASLRRTVFFIAHMKKLLDDLDTQNLASVRKSFNIALEKLNQRLLLQYRAIAKLALYMEEAER